MGHIYTDSDIRALNRDGKKTLCLKERDRLTDLAKHSARTLGIRVLSEEEYQLELQFKHEKESEYEGENTRNGEEKHKTSLSSVTASISNAKEIAIQREPAPYDLVIKNGICVIPEIGRIELNVCIKDGKIKTLTTDQDIVGRQILDAKGLYVLPGIIDPHTHLGLFAPLETELETETRSALLGGVTTIGTYFNFDRSYLSFIDELRADVSKLSRVDMIPHLTLRNQQQLEELPMYSSKGMNSFKMYMCGVKGIFPNQEDGFIIRAMKRIKDLPPDKNPIISFHCENQSICDYAEEDWDEKGGVNNLDEWNSTHPNFAEGEAVQRAAYFAKVMNVRTYIVHSSTKEAMELLPSVKCNNLYVETTSPYLTLDTGSDIGVYGKMTPPIREEASRQALWEALKSGLIDTIGTDNTVMNSTEKNVDGGMNEAVAGYPTLGTHLPSVLTEGIFRQEVMIESLVPLMTMNPAKIFGVYPEKGTILPGSDADLVLVDLENTQTVNPSRLLSRSDFSLFQGKQLRAWPKATIKAGRIAAWNGKIVDDSVRGAVLDH